jgi:Fe-S cluster biogenesis protein NfuA
LLVGEGESHDYPDRDSAENAPLATELFDNFSFITRVFYMNNFVTVTKNETLDWDDARLLISNFIKLYLEEDKPVLTGEIQSSPPVSGEGDSEIVSQIKNVLDEYIKPAVEMDGGAITFESYNKGVVKVLLQGSCSGCPSSTITLKAGIESLLKRAIPEIETVVAEGV